MKMVEVKTAELIGSALDWAVAYHLNGDPVFFKAFGARVLGRRITTEVANGNISPSTKWSQGGPLIEEYLCKLFTPQSSDEWSAVVKKQIAPPWVYGYGPTPLIAACRAIVEAKLGDVMSVPAELVAGGGV